MEQKLPIRPNEVTSKSGTEATLPSVSPSRKWFWGWVLALLVVVVVIVIIVAVQGIRSAESQPSSSGAETPNQAATEMKFVRIPAGRFAMGSNSPEAYDQEKPVHQVTISRPFELQTTEVTQAQWQAVMGNNPSNFQGDDLPVEQVSWDDCQAFIRKLNEMDPGQGYRLPTEAEWEYACRAGTEGDRYGDLDAVAWYWKNFEGKTHPVGQKQPNAYGVYDMLGNVWEWSEDLYGDYSSGSATDPTGPSSGSGRVYRGGCWGDGARCVRAPGRCDDLPGSRYNFLGLRLARAAH